MRKYIISIACAVSLCLLAVLLNITTPATAGPFGILAIFVLSYVFIFGAVSFVIFWANYLISHLSGIVMSSKPVHAITLKRASYYATIIAALPIILIGLQSVGRVGIYEYILMSIFTLIGCLYVYKKVS